MSSGFSPIAGSVLAAYIAMGVPAQNLVTSSVMSIPASISISKMRFPEKDEPITRGRVVVDRGEDEKNRPVGHSFECSSGLISSRQTLSMHSAKELCSVLLLQAKSCMCPIFVGYYSLQFPGRIF